MNILCKKKGVARNTAIIPKDCRCTDCRCTLYTRMYNNFYKTWKFKYIFSIHYHFYLNIRIVLKWMKKRTKINDIDKKNSRKRKHSYNRRNKELIKNLNFNNFWRILFIRKCVQYLQRDLFSLYNGRNLIRL